jgi:hypothetical protein
MTTHRIPQEPHYFSGDAHDLHIAVLHDMGARLHRSLEGAHRALWPEMYRALDEAHLAVIDVPAEARMSFAVIDDRLFDCVSGDMHVLTPAEQWEEEEGVIAIQSIAMLDTCLGSLPELQAACLLVELERDGIYVTPKHCTFCGRTHLVRGR